MEGHTCEGQGHDPRRKLHPRHLQAEARSDDDGTYRALELLMDLKIIYRRPSFQPYERTTENAVTRMFCNLCTMRQLMFSTIPDENFAELREVTFGSSMIGMGWFIYPKATGTCVLFLLSSAASH